MASSERAKLSAALGSLPSRAVTHGNSGLQEHRLRQLRFVSAQTPHELIVNGVAQMEAQRAHPKDDCRVRLYALLPRLVRLKNSVEQLLDRIYTSFCRILVSALNKNLFVVSAEIKLSALTHRPR